MSEITRYPLFWPAGVPRTPPHQRRRPQFTPKTFDWARKFVLGEIDRLNCKHGWTVNEQVIISTMLRLRADYAGSSSLPEPKDVGVAVYFPLYIERGEKKLERPIVMTCDKWITVAWNLYAIGMDISAQRGRIRWGCTNYEQSFRGYLALPERGAGKPWWETLGVKPDATADAIKKAFRVKSLSEHPDKGGSHDNWVVIQEAYDQALAQLK